MGTFRKKPVVIEAAQFTDPPSIAPAWLSGAFEAGTVYYQGGPEPYLTIQTLEGPMRASLGDWIIRGVKGEIYACKPDIFAATYEPADDTVEAGGCAPQVPEGMVSVPVRLPALAVSEIKDMLASDYRMHDIQARPLWAEFLRIVAGLSIEKQEEINEYRAVAGVAASTPPLNEPSGGSGQLASLEQRARALPVVPQAFFDEFGEIADDRVMDYGQACYDAALSAQPRGVDVVDRALAYLRPHLEAGTFAAPDWAISLASILTGGNAAPQPREVRGVDEIDPALARFYGVDTVAGLVAAMEENIAKLQDLVKRNVKPWEDTFPPTLLPKHIRDQGALLNKDALALAQGWEDKAAESWGESPEHKAMRRCCDELRAMCGATTPQDAAEVELRDDGATP